MNYKKIKIFIRKIGYHSKPTFIIVGAQKAGTTGLYRTLIEHSQIVGSTRKEINYFDNDEWYLKNKIEEYHSYFPFPNKIAKSQLVFEATPEYLYHPKAAERIFNYNSKMKIIIMLREPSSRAFSAWSMYHFNFKTGKNSSLHDPRTFKEAISQDHKNIEDSNFYNNQRGYIARGIYYKQIEEYLKYFPKEQVLFVESSRLLTDHENVMHRIFDFLNVQIEPVPLKIKNKSKKDTPNINHKDIDNLKDFYQYYNEKLFDLIKQKYDWNV